MTHGPVRRVFHDQVGNTCFNAEVQDTHNMGVYQASDSFGLSMKVLYIPACQISVQ